MYEYVYLSTFNSDIEKAVKEAGIRYEKKRKPGMIKLVTETAPDEMYDIMKGVDSVISLCRMGRDKIDSIPARYAESHDSIVKYSHEKYGLKCSPIFIVEN